VAAPRGPTGDLFPPVELHLQAPALDLSGPAAPRVEIQPHTEELFDTGQAFVISRREEIERSQSRLKEAVAQLEAAQLAEERALGQQVARVQGEYQERLARLEAQFRKKAEELRSDAAAEVERERTKSQRALQVKTMALMSVVGGRPTAPGPDSVQARGPAAYDPTPRNFRRGREVPPPPPGLRARFQGAGGQDGDSESSSDEGPRQSLQRHRAWGKPQAAVRLPEASGSPPPGRRGVTQQPDAEWKAHKPLRIARLLSDSEDDEW